MIYKTLEFFNFGTTFINYIKTIYTDISTQIINNGNLSDPFTPQRGVRQGCPLSPYLFIITVELLACKIRQNQEINGIKIGDAELKISQLADDTICFIDNCNSIPPLLSTFHIFEKCSGLKVNIEKTSITYIGKGKIPQEI